MAGKSAIKRVHKNEKTTNLFRFRSFSEQVACIKIDVVHHVGGPISDTPSDQQTFFHEALLKWRELNCTIPFVDFFFEVIDKVQSLAQLFHHKDLVIAKLKEHLQKKDPLELEPLLDLLVQLARDLQIDFYPFFKDFFPLLVSLCITQDASIIEKVFMCLAYLFKFLWRHMLRDITNVFRLYSKLLVATQKDHIRKFAVESFGFLLRKVRNTDGLCDMILSAVNNQPELTEGVGHLLFEVCKGVRKQFHSCTEKILPTICLKLSQFPQNNSVFQAICEMVELMADHTHKDFALPIWNALLDSMEQATQVWSSDQSDSSAIHLSRLLHLVGIMTSWREGTRIPSTITNRLCILVLTLVQNPSLPLTTRLPAVTLHLITSLLLLGSVLSGCGLTIEEIVQSVFQHWKCLDHVTEFVWELMNSKYQKFNEVLLPQCLQYCEVMAADENNWNNLVAFLTRLCLYQDVSLALSNSLYSENSVNKMYESILEKELDVFENNMTLSVVWCVLKSLQYIYPISENLKTLVCRIFKALWSTLQFNNLSSPSVTHSNQLLTTFSQCMHTLVVTLEEERLLNMVSIETIVTILKQYPSQLCVLKAVLKYCSTIKERYSTTELTQDHLEVLVPLLQTNLSLSSDSVRSTTLRILCCFPQLPLVIEKEDSIEEEHILCDIFQVCLKAEEIPVTLTTYRNKIVWLSKLNYISHRFNMLPELYKEIPLQYLLGVLYVNFNLLWDPISDLISSYACMQLKDLFWSIFGTTLETASTSAGSIDDSSLSFPEAVPAINTNYIEDIFLGHIIELQELQKGHPDHVNYRQLLWQCMEKFSGLAEGRSRLLVPLLYQFIENEYGLTDETFMYTQDISEGNIETIDSSKERGDTPLDTSDKEVVTLGAEDTCIDSGTQVDGSIPQQEDNSLLQEDIPFDEDVEEEDRTVCDKVVSDSLEEKTLEETATEREMLNVSEDRRTKYSIKKNRRLNKILIVMLTLLSKFTNPRGLYRHGDLQQLYMKLLMNQDIKIQSLALACLITYKPPYLLPYKENLEELLNDDTFREQLLLLSSSSEESLVAVQHVEGLVPVLIRILYGRIRRNTKTSSNSLKKQSILRFLATCGDREMAEFVTLITAPFQSLQNLSPVSAKAVIPLRKQQGFLRELKQLVTIAGNQLEPHLPSIFPLVLELAATCVVLLTEQRNQVAPKYINLLKVIRQSIFQLVCEILDIFSYIDHTPYQDDLLSSLVWPQVARLPHECIQHPTPLLKLLLVWSQHTQLHYLFTSTVPSYLSLSSTTLFPVLHFVYQCLLNKNISSKVSHTILELTLNLIKGEEEEEEFENDIEDGFVNHPVDDCIPLEDPPPLGLELVKYFVPILLEYLSSVIRNNSKQQNKVEDNLQLEFDVLSRISSHITTEHDAELLIELLLPFLSNPSQSKRDSDQILTTILKLISSVSTVSKFYSSLSKLFSILNKRKDRETLCNIFKEVAVKDNTLSSTAEIVLKINSWNPHLVDEPYYELRQEGFSDGRQLLTSLKLDTKNEALLILPILYNAIYFINQSDDISIRDAAGSFVSSIIQTISMNNTQTFDLLLLGTLLPSLKTGLRTKRDATMNEFIDILSQLVVAYPTHPQFSDLVQLSHPDAEVNFFHNIHHIQLHRRTKAFRKLAAVCSDGHVSQNTMMSYLLPLASHIVFSPLSSREHNLLLEAVNVIGVISSKLKWTNYFYLLKHYLRQLSRRMDIHRNIIRAVVSILDHFHFEISEPKTHPQDSDTPKKEKIKDNDHFISLPDKIHSCIVKQILPDLQSCLTLQSELPQHRLSHKEDNSDAEKLRVPVAMAMTKLLLRLPESSLEIHLPGLLLKVCQTLRNRAHDVRDVARTTLLKMSQTLGSRFLQFILKELRDTLTRGYQLHILSYTVHHLIHGLTSILKPGDLDSCLDHFHKTLIPDLFGSPAEEREVNEFISKTPEGKKCKSVHTFGLVARYLSPSLVPALLQPVREILETQSTSKVATVVEDIFKKVVYGILGNKEFTPQILLLFIHGILNQSIPQLKPKPKSKVSQDDSSLRPLDCRLLPPNPSRSKPRLAQESNLSAHLVTHFGLQLLDISLKRGKLKSSSEEHLRMLDPFVPLLSEALTSRHIKMLSRTLQCVMRILSFPLPSLKVHVSDITSHLFGVLKHYSYIGAVSTDSNQELIATAFKSMTMILQEYTHYKISEDELRLLLSYVEQDVHDYKRQSTAFPLLKAILTRKFLVVELHDVMSKISELVVNGDTSKVRANSRHAVLQFMLTYTLSKKINNFLDFFVANISYEEQPGRESVLEMLNLIFNKFPEKVLKRQSSYFFVPLASQLINDDSPLCRKMIAEILKTLMKKVGKEQRNDMVTMVSDWLGHNKFLHKQLGVLILGLLVEVEEKDFEQRLPTILPLVATYLVQDDNYIIREQDNIKQPQVEGVEEDIEMEEDQRATITSSEHISNSDHLLFSVLVTLEKIFIHCGINASIKCNIWDSVQNHLLHPHTWVRHASSKLFGLLFASCSVDTLIPVLLGEHNISDKNNVCIQFFNGGKLQTVKSLQDTFMNQLKAPLLSSDVANQAIKNLIFIAKLLFMLSKQSDTVSIKTGKRKLEKTIDNGKRRKFDDGEEIIKEATEEEEDTIEEEVMNERVDILQPEVQLRRLIYQMDKLARYEVGHYPKEPLKRTHVFKWIAAVAMVIGEEHLSDWLVDLLPPLYKELADTKITAGSDLHSLAEEVIDHIKKICGKAVFSQAYSTVHSIAQSVRMKRKAQHALEVVTNPEKSIKQKWRKNLLKREARKRKLLERLHPSISANKRVKLLLKRRHY